MLTDFRKGRSLVCPFNQHPRDQTERKGFREDPSKNRKITKMQNQTYDAQTEESVAGKGYRQSIMAEMVSESLSSIKGGRPHTMA
jgi:hypothetical protein